MISDSSDLDRFYGALLRGELLPPKQLKEMKTTVATGEGDGYARYGLGLADVTLPCGVHVWGHGGGRPPFPGVQLQRGLVGGRGGGGGGRVLRNVKPPRSYRLTSSMPEQPTQQASPAYQKGVVQNHTISVLYPLLQWHFTDSGKLPRLTDVSVESRPMSMYKPSPVLSAHRSSGCVKASP